MGCCATVTSKDPDNFFKQRLVFQGFSANISAISQLQDLNRSQFLFEKPGNFKESYELTGETISTSSRSTIFKGIHKLTGSLVAIKEVKLSNLSQLSENARKNYVQGLEILKKLDHPNVLKLLDIYNDGENLQIVTEFYNGGELFEKLLKNKHFSEAVSAKIIKQILLGLNYLHKNRVVHRGITPENLVFQGSLANFLVKIVDFKLLTFLPPNARLSEKVGAVLYIAPEILAENYDFKCDLWACGVLVFTLLCGRFPFDGEDNASVFKNIKSGKCSQTSAEFKSLSLEAKDFIEKLLKVQPEDRLSAEDALQHAWLREISRNRLSISKILNFSAVENLKKFRIYYKLQKILWIFLIDYFVKAEEKDELSRFFHELDKEGKGFLDKSDLVALLQRSKGGDAAKEAENIVNSFGNSGENREKISFSEFLMASLEKKSFVTEERLKTAFSALDKGNKGKLCVNDLKLAFGGETIQENVWKELICEVSPKNSGDFLSFEDFKSVIMK